MEKSNSFRQEGNQLIHTRLLNASRELVWEVWTSPQHLKEWWGPEGFTITNKSMEVKPGRDWNFIMHGFGQDFDNRIRYMDVVKPSLLTYQHGDPGGTLSFMVYITFEEVPGDKTFLTVRSVFESAEVIAEMDRKVNAIESGKQTINKMETYVNQYNNNLKKINRMAKVGTYLNFSRNTEEAFNFYRSVFGGEFVGGISRLGDIPPQEGMPALADGDKNLVMHVALPIFGNHLLMGTDAPESMGFKLNPGNNVHINLEPDSREQAKKLFEALAAGGTVTMPLSDMFWGAYYGSCTDKFGIQWMVNYTEAKK
jgi:uncharacterized glyoxalase superfamily protein PhnB/uncharacterized protein YndB with AHSA1/START domain